MTLKLTEAQQQARRALDKVMNYRFDNFDAGAVIHWAERGMYQVKVDATMPEPSAAPELLECLKDARRLLTDQDAIDLVHIDEVISKAEVTVSRAETAEEVTP